MNNKENKNTHTICKVKFQRKLVTARDEIPYSVDLDFEILPYDSALFFTECISLIVLMCVIVSELLLYSNL